MKVLTPFLALSLLCNVALVANENNTSLDDYLSGLKQEQFKYDYQKNEAESSKLRDSWIAPLQLKYSYSRSKPLTKELTSQNAAIRMDQPIFQSGGIYYGIKFANASKYYSDYTIEVAKRKMIKDTVSILMQIKQQELRIKSQKLQITNSDINLAQKKEQYLSGQLDSGFLDNAIIQRNIVIQTLYDMDTAKERLVNSFKVLSDLDYKTAYIPHLELISVEEFLNHNIVLKQRAAEIEKNQYYKDVVVAKYLPKVNLIAGYTWNDSEQFFGEKTPIFSNTTNFYDYGVRVTAPLDINIFRDIESAKVDFLKAQVVQKDKERELKALFDQVMQNIENFNKKKLLSLENKDIYTRLLNETKDLFKAGYKTEYDVGLLENSVAISELNYQIYEIDKQLELLTLYEMYKK